MKNIIIENLLTIRNLCIKYHVLKLYIFGSVVNEKFNSKSDIDLIVKFNDIPLKEYSDNYFSLKEEFKKQLNREIDLIEEESISNPHFLEEILKTRELIYG